MSKIKKLLASPEFKQSFSEIDPTKGLGGLNGLDSKVFMLLVDRDDVTFTLFVSDVKRPFIDPVTRKSDGKEFQLPKLHFKVACTGDTTLSSDKVHEGVFKTSTFAGMFDLMEKFDDQILQAPIKMVVTDEREAGAEYPVFRLSLWSSDGKEVGLAEYPTLAKAVERIQSFAGVAAGAGAGAPTI